ncbi:MAG: hypothetical protein KOO62_03320 [candidate division Zixibacteria bacterium]|nr:hypothetical protein [candidate division Zixibacteria bacterium]
MRRPHLVTRIALFAALVYVLSWGTSYLPNINFIFFIVFSAGFLWGVVPGALVGMIGMALWTAFNPYGPAIAPVMLAQIIGAGSGSMVGAVFRKGKWQNWTRPRLIVSLWGAALMCTVLYYLPVNIVDAWMFGPFYERFVGGMLFSAISLGANLIIFPLLFTVTRHLHARERTRL